MTKERFLLGMGAALVGICLVTACVNRPAARAEEDAGPDIDFARDIRPIFAEHCLRCHGPKRQEGGLRLDVARAALRGGDSGAAIKPKDAAGSYLIERVTAEDELERMPPEGRALSAKEIDRLQRWIDAGAAWPESASGQAAVQSDHWSFQPVQRPAVPDVENADAVRNSIDAFVVSRLEREGFRPAPEADRSTLIRRLYLDMLGLPPTPEEADAFVADPRPDAYERLVDRVLASPHYGERWARRWLDLARYSDTNGYEKDRARSIWPYRDWVINALNADMPFDQFTIEQLAGDMLPNATLEQRIATGFHRNTMVNEEGGIDVAEFRYYATVDRANTTGTVWLGLTIRCAQCHTHKYDPITQREYYRFLAFFNNADEPEIAVPQPEITQQRQEKLDRIAQIEADMLRKFPAIEKDYRAWATKASAAAHRWRVVRPTRVISQRNATMTVLDDGSVLASGDIPNRDVYVAEFEWGAEPITAVRLEVLPHASLPNDGPGRSVFNSGAGAKGDFLLSEVTLAAASLDGGEPRPVSLVKPTHSHALNKRSAESTLDGESDTGWSIGDRTGEAHHAVYPLAEPIDSPAGSRLVLTLDQHYIHQMTIGRFRVSVTGDALPIVSSGLPAEIEAVLAQPTEEREIAEREQLKQYYTWSVAPALEAQRKEIARLRKSLPEYPTTMVMQERRPEHRRTTRIHQRGEFLKPTEEVSPAVPAVLHAFPDELPRNRLSLARWLVDERNPLAARVVMNRTWATIFGRGIVRTTEDFGTQGERPTYPGLLDWLAAEFMDCGWSMKHMHRVIVTSATYRRSSHVTPEMLQRDPTNALLTRGPRFRMEAEIIRDVALRASGLLTEELGGPSVFPPQPDGVTALSYGALKWKTSTGADRYRRGLYTFSKRTAPYAAFVLFDAPSGETCTVRRERSNTPLQALTMLNDEVFLEAAQELARRVVAEDHQSPQARAARIFRLCLTRPPHPEEAADLVAFYQRQRARFEAGELDPRQAAGLGDGDHVSAEEAARLAAWTTVARAILNFDETITKE